MQVIASCAILLSQGIVNFRFWPDSWDREDADTTRKAEIINAEISRRAIALNIAAPLTTRLNGALNLRMCAIHPNLTSEGMLGILHELDKSGTEAVKDLEGHLLRSTNSEALLASRL